MENPLPSEPHFFNLSHFRTIVTLRAQIFGS
jgi:hypothetical protein